MPRLAIRWVDFDFINRYTIVYWVIAKLSYEIGSFANVCLICCKKESTDMECKGAIFDMDGLLFDTEKVFQQTWHEIADEYNVALDKDFARKICGTTGADTLRIIEEYYHVSDSDSEVIAQDCVKRVRKKLAAYVPLKEGVHEILDFFKQKNIKMAVASSSFMQQIEANLKLVGIRDYFDAVVSGEEVSLGKPAPDIFLYAAKKIGCMPQECFVFEDSINGIKAGHAAGCMTIMVPDLVEATPQIRPYCTGVYSSLPDFVKEAKLGEEGSVNGDACL